MTAGLTNFFPVLQAFRTGQTPHRATRAVQINAPNSMIA
jgi:hypothetical protein